jgi:nucleoside 2-deoxyribosyltransferase
MRYYEKLLLKAEELRALGLDVELPENMTMQLVRKSELISRHLAKLRESDLLLLGNIDGYIGVSTFFEAGWAYALGKPVFSLEKLDENNKFTEELRAIGVVELEGNLGLLKEKK